MPHATSNVANTRNIRGDILPETAVTAVPMGAHFTRFVVAPVNCAGYRATSVAPWSNVAKDLEISVTASETTLARIIAHPKSGI